MSRVLIIDDEPSVLLMCRTILTDAGHQVREAPDGPRGLALARSGGFDAVIVDLMMPHMDGFEVMAQLRGDDATRHLPIVVLTAKTRREDPSCTSSRRRQHSSSLDTAPNSSAS